MPKNKKKRVVLRSVEELKKHYYRQSEPNDIFKMADDPAAIGVELARRSLRKAGRLLSK